MENNAVIKGLLIPEGIVPVCPLWDRVSTGQNGPEVSDKDVSDD